MFIGGHAEPDLTVRLKPLLPTAYQVSEPGKGSRFVLGLDSQGLQDLCRVNLHLTFTFNNIAAHGIPPKHLYARVSRLSFG